MKILEEKISQTFANDYVTKKLVVEHECLSDIDYHKPIKKEYLALYKKDKLIGLISNINKNGIIVPQLFEIALFNQKSKYGVFNVNEGKMVYRGNEKPHFNEDGFVISKVIKVETQFNFSGKTEFTQSGNKRTYSKNTSSLYVD